MQVDTRLRLRLPPELAHIQIMIHTASGQQFAVRAPLHDAVILDDQQLIGVADGAQPVGNDEAGTALQQFLQCGLDQPLGARVHARRGLIEDEDAGVGQDGAGNGQKLPLPLA